MDSLHKPNQHHRVLENGYDLSLIQSLDFKDTSRQEREHSCEFASWRAIHCLHYQETLELSHIWSHSLTGIGYGNEGEGYRWGIVPGHCFSHKLIRFLHSAYSFGHRERGITLIDRWYMMIGWLVIRCRWTHYTVLSWDVLIE